MLYNSASVPWTHSIKLEHNLWTLSLGSLDPRISRFFELALLKKRADIQALDIFCFLGCFLCKVTTDHPTFHIITENQGSRSLLVSANFTAAAQSRIIRQSNRVHLLWKLRFFENLSIVGINRPKAYHITLMNDDFYRLSMVTWLPGHTASPTAWAESGRIRCNEKQLHKAEYQAEHLFICFGIRQSFVILCTHCNIRPEAIKSN